MEFFVFFPPYFLSPVYVRLFLSRLFPLFEGRRFKLSHSQRRFLSLLLYIWTSFSDATYSFTLKQEAVSPNGIIVAVCRATLVTEWFGEAVKL
jgi:hypothetical protein